MIGTKKSFFGLARSDESVGIGCDGSDNLTFRDGVVSGTKTLTELLATAAHAATHVNGTDDVQTATAAQKGLMSATAMSKLDGIEAGADVTDATNVATAGAIMATIVNAKGDLVVASAADTVDRLPVGNNGYFLQADSGQGLGARWAPSFPEFQFSADQLQNPLNADWTVNALAPAAADSNNNALPVRLFDDTTAEGIGFQILVPTGALNLKFTFVSRAETAPATSKHVRLACFNRSMPDNLAVTAWSAATDLTALDMPANEYWQVDTQTIALSTLGVTAGRLTQFEITRDTAEGDDDLVGDWVLLLLRVEFTV